jgi:type II secretory pathway component GspD/PulD (secretin)
MRLNFAGLDFARQGRRTMKVAKGIVAVALGVVLSGTGAWAQTAPAPVKGPDVAPAKSTADVDAARPRRELPCDRPDACTLQTFYLGNVSQPSDANEILTAIRNIMPPDIRLYLVPSQNAIVLRATPEQMATAQKIINDLDRPKKLFRLTYTISEMDGGKRTNTQRFSMVAADGQKVTLKQGSRVPVATGSYSSSGSVGVQTQFQYLDLGMTFDATAVSVAGGALLKAKVEQSSAADDKMIAEVREPVIRQATLEGTSVVKLGKPLMLGSLDIPGTTAHLEVEVLVEAVP